MDDYKIMDSFDDYDPEKEGLPKKTKLIIIIVASLFFGLSAFLVSYIFLGDKNEEEVPITTTTLNINDEEVVELYKMVTYGDRGVRNEKFIKEDRVSLDSFSNYEKFYYALQFAQVADFSNSGNTAANGKKIYTISNDKVKQYMNRFFGKKITYSTEGVNTMTFDFMIENSNVGTMSYDIDRDSFATTFSGVNKDFSFNGLVLPYYTELVSAVSKSDGTMELKEKIIYTSIVQNKDGYGRVMDSYNVNVYKDFAKTMLIESKTNLTSSTLKQYPISLANYDDSASTITYTFKKQSSGYYFENSVINNQAS